MVVFVKPEERYIRTYWESFKYIAEEGVYLATSEVFPYESTVRFVRNCLEKEYPQLFAIDTETDRCVGWCDAVPRDNRPTGYLGTGLLPEYRNKGIGRKLIREIIEMSREFGYASLELEVRSSNRRAIHVYELLGFSIYNIMSGGYRIGNAVVDEDVVCMRLELDKGPGGSLLDILNARR